MKKHLRAFLPGSILCAILAHTCAAQPKLRLEEAAQKILQENCLTCHGQTQMSGLDLRQIDTILKGGKRGPAVVRGQGSACGSRSLPSARADASQPSFSR